MSGKSAYASISSIAIPQSGDGVNVNILGVILNEDNTVDTQFQVTALTHVGDSIKDIRRALETEFQVERGTDIDLIILDL